MKWLALLVAVLFVPAPASAEARPTLIAMDSRRRQRLRHLGGWTIHPHFLPRSGVSAIWMYTIADRTWSQITDGKGGDREPAWSPDSRRAVFVSGRDGQTDLWIVDIATRTIQTADQ